jgi:hypothetical protein
MKIENLEKKTNFSIEQLTHFQHFENVTDTLQLLVVFHLRLITQVQQVNTNILRTGFMLA